MFQNLFHEYDLELDLSDDFEWLVYWEESEDGDTHSIESSGDLADYLYDVTRLGVEGEGKLTFTEIDNQPVITASYEPEEPSEWRSRSNEVNEVYFAGSPHILEAKKALEELLDGEYGEVTFVE